MAAVGDMLGGSIGGRKARSEEQARFMMRNCIVSAIECPINGSNPVGTLYYRNPSAIALSNIVAPCSA